MGTDRAGSLGTCSDTGRWGDCIEEKEMLCSLRAYLRELFAEGNRSKRARQGGVWLGSMPELGSGDKQVTQDQHTYINTPCEHRNRVVDANRQTCAELPRLFCIKVT